MRHRAFRPEMGAVSPLRYAPQVPAQGSKRPHDTTGEATRPSARRPRDRQVPSNGSEVTEGHIVQAVAAQEDLGVQRDRLAELRVGSGQGCTERH